MAKHTPIDYLPFDEVNYMRTNRTMSAKKDEQYNVAGGVKDTITAKEQLSQIVTTYFFKEPKFYGNSTVDENLQNSVEFLAKHDPEFVLKTAGYCRTVLGMRSTPLYLLVKASTIPNTKPLVRKYAPYIIKRTDELTEVLAMYRKLFANGISSPEGKLYNKKIPNCLKKAVRDSFKKFDEYQFAKYNKNTEFTLKDAIMLTHPKEPSENIKKILDDNLKTPETWETIISNYQENGFSSKKEAWKYVIRYVFLKGGKVNNIMAVIRNLKNMAIELGNDEELNYLLSKLENIDKKKLNKVFPFMFYTAYKMLDNYVGINSLIKSRIADTLRSLAEKSFSGLDELDGETVIAVDTSGSMWMQKSISSIVNDVDVANFYGAVLKNKSENGRIIQFNSRLREVEISNTVKDDIISYTDALMRDANSGGTLGYLVPQYLYNNNIKPKRVIVITDEQMWEDMPYKRQSFKREWRKYKELSPETHLHIVDVSGYGETVIKTQDRVNKISGLSNKILDFIPMVEEGGNTLIDEIESFKGK